MSQLFDSVVSGNQNMLRLWASGPNLPDFIYDIADERGVLLWSEFQFSDALYPVDQAFLDNVAAEVLYNVRRLNHHPSLALWAGGNELEADVDIVLGAGYTLYQAQYEELFIGLIAPIIWKNSHSISYMPSSANYGYYYIDPSLAVPIAERYYNVTPGDYYGITEYYIVNSDIAGPAFNLDAYQVGRFAVEFGFHSMPSLQTWQQEVPDEDLQEFNSTVVVLRNHHNPPGGLSINTTNSLFGMGQMTIAVETYYPIPDKTDPLTNFSAWCLATQRFQADFDKSQISFYRRGSGRPERQLGSLYWQLEDIWQAPTWAGIEYGGRWKVLHYVAEDMYQNVIIAPYWNYTNGDLNITITSDLWESLSGRATLTWLDLTGQPLPNNAGTPSSVSFSVGAINTTDVYTTNLAQLSIPDPENAILLLSLQASGYRPNSDTITSFGHENYFLPVWPNQAKLVNPGLSVSYDARTKNFTIEAKSGVSLYTWLDYPAGTVGHFDKNSFVVVPGQPKEIGFTVQSDTTNGQWVKGVTVQSIWDQGQK
jgi:beta-mannosidase